MLENQIDWLLESDEPWTRYRTLVDLLEFPSYSKEVLSARQAMLDYQPVQGLTDLAATWPGYPLKRHNDAGHPLYALSTLADFGLTGVDPRMGEILSKIIEHSSPEGMLESQLLIPEAFGGSGHEQWSWILCDTPSLLYSVFLISGAGANEWQDSLTYISSLVEENGWRCTAAPNLGKFRGPGRVADPCPMANVLALKAFSTAGVNYAQQSKFGTEMLLHHWEIRREKKYYLFGMGTDFLKLKYPFVWYDILHVVDVLSRFPWVYDDPRFNEMVDAITSQANEDGLYTASSMYRSWKGWSFADKKQPSPWLTFLVLRIQKRMEHSIWFQNPSMMYAP
jgi:hypothetical protein